MMPTQEVVASPSVIKLFTYPTPPQTGGIVVTSDDLYCLFETRFINDTIIDFYLKYLFNERLTSRRREKTHIFSSYFFLRLKTMPLTPRPGDETTENVQAKAANFFKNWTKDMDIFSKDFIIIPANRCKHWFLAVICYPGLVPEVTESTTIPKHTAEEGRNRSKVIIKKSMSKDEGDNLNQDENSTTHLQSPHLISVPITSDSTILPKRPCIYIFDSFKRGKFSDIASLLRKFLEIEWRNKKGTNKRFDSTTMEGIHLECPQQSNAYDCGLYVMQFATNFLENPEAYCGNPTPDLTHWFEESDISERRLKLIETIACLHEAFLMKR